MTYGPGSPAAVEQSWRSVAWVSNVCVVDGGSLVPVPNRA